MMMILFTVAAVLFIAAATHATLVSVDAWLGPHGESGAGEADLVLPKILRRLLAARSD